MKNKNAPFVDWFRSASPYIHSHRGKTFIVYFGGEAVLSEGFSELIHDLSLLSSLGIRLVVVHGVRPQVEQRLAQKSIEAKYDRGLRITDHASLECVKEAVGITRVEIEALFSTGLINSPMAGAQIRVSSGNFLTARPIGIRDGVDFLHTGQVRKLDTQSINKRLQDNEIVLISPIGYSPTGEAFNLSALDVASSTALALAAEKLILITESDKGSHAPGELFRQLTVGEAEAVVERSKFSVPELDCALSACKQGIHRVHMIDRKLDGSLLLELFTRDGVGMMLSAEPFDEIRKANIDDVGGVLDLIAPLEENGVLVKRSRERLEIEIAQFTVMVRDHTIIACAALFPSDETGIAELSCLAVHADYLSGGRGEALLSQLEREATSAGLTKLFVLTTQTTHWFIERGYQEGVISDLPVSRQAMYNYQRNSRVLIKVLVN